MVEEVGTGAVQEAESRLKALVYVLLALCLLMTSLNAYLLHQVKRLKTVTEGQALPVAEGKVVMQVSGLDLAGKQVIVPTARKLATVLMVFSPTCPYCEKNWPQWSKLVKRFDSANIEFVAIDLTSKATPDFINARNLGRAIVLGRINPKEYVSLNLNVTPQTIMIGGDSKVKKVWSGVLTDRELGDIDHLLDGSHEVAQLR